jgi:hypothetical protein
METRKTAWRWGIVVAVGLLLVCLCPPPAMATNDEDGDGVPDDVDNCVAVPNPGQQDDDGDTVGNVCDNCPARWNEDQANHDTDGLGDACDSDKDGDNAQAWDWDWSAPGPDCDDLNPEVLPSSAACQTPAHRIGLRLASESGSGAGFRHYKPGALFAMTDGVGGWLPDVGVTAPGQRSPVALDLEAVVIDGEGNEVPLTPAGAPVHVRMRLVFESTESGDYTNDGPNSTEQDFDKPVDFESTDQLSISPFDYGGRFTMDVTDLSGLVNGGNAVSVTLPYDSDGDTLPDAWEKQYAPGNAVADLEDGDRSGTSNLDNGDGLTAFDEYRGFLWGDLEKAENMTLPVPWNQVYQTPAFLQKLDASGNPLLAHFRTDPTRKDLFLMYTGFSGTYAGYVANPDTAQPPFAIGYAYDEQLIHVHAWNMAPPPGGWGDPTGVQDVKIDPLQVENDLTGHYQNHDGHIKWLSVRSWDFDTLGKSGVGSPTQYGPGTKDYYDTLALYFGDVPYWDQYEPNHSLKSCGGCVPNVLDPIGVQGLEDTDDNGDVSGHGPNSEDHSSQGGDDDRKLDGDHVDAAWEASNPGHPEHDLSPFDVDQDDLLLPAGQGNHGLEQPGVAAVGPNVWEYSRAQVFKHVLTHEIGHAVGITHLNDPTGVMFNTTNNWLRDGHFSDVADESIQIHNQIGNQ